MDAFRQNETEWSKETVDLNHMLDQIILTAFHTMAAKYTFFSRTQGTFQITEHILDYKTSLKFGWSHTKCLFWYKSRNKWNKRNWKIQKYVEIKQHITK